MTIAGEAATRSTGTGRLGSGAWFVAPERGPCDLRLLREYRRKRRAAVGGGEKWAVASGGVGGEAGSGAYASIVDRAIGCA